MDPLDACKYDCTDDVTNTCVMKLSYNNSLSHVGHGSNAGMPVAAGRIPLSVQPATVSFLSPLPEAPRLPNLRWRNFSS